MRQVAPKEEDKHDVKFQFHNFTVDTLVISITERQGSSSRSISHKAEIYSLSQNKLSSYVDVDFIGYDLSLEPEHSSDVVPKAAPLEGNFPSRLTTSEDPYPSKDYHRIDINELRAIGLIAEDNSTSGPYYSSYSTIIENSKMAGSRRVIPSPECDFIDIDDLLGASTTKYRLSLPLNKIKEEALKAIDLTGIGKTGIINLCFI